MKTPFPHLNAPKDGYVFVVTYGRSGSTLLQNLLNALPGYCIRGENAGVLSHLAQAWRAVETEQSLRNARHSGETTGSTHPWFGGELIRPMVFGRNLSDGFVRDVLCLPAETRVGGFKEIRYHNAHMFRTTLNFMKTFFPKAKFVFNTRDHGAVAQSAWWKEKPESEVRAYLEETEGFFHGWERDNPETSFRLHYDDYVTEPENLRRFFEFLGEPFDLDLIKGVMSHRLTHMQP